MKREHQRLDRRLKRWPITVQLSIGRRERHAVVEQTAGAKNRRVGRGQAGFFIRAPTDATKARIDAGQSAANVPGDNPGQRVAAHDARTRSSASFARVKLIMPVSEASGRLIRCMPDHWASPDYGEGVILSCNAKTLRGR